MKTNITLQLTVDEALILAKHLPTYHFQNTKEEEQLYILKSDLCDLLGLKVHDL